jgi:hypothetical protein
VKKEKDSAGEFLKVQVSPNASSAVGPSHFAEYIWDAKEMNTTEVPIGAPYTNSGCTGNAWVVVDATTNLAYAIKIELKTTTSRSVSYIRIPALAEKK